ncbi:MAG: carbamoyltransferase HypF [Nitrospirae bacterium]|nr:carbamoyltransferase HypF [Nitrospirota bacterium]
MKRLHITIKGIVQGVGFRPFIYNLAKSLDINGYVTNTSGGVIIKAEGERLDEFLGFIQTQCPPLAKIDSIETHEMPAKGYEGFSIIESLDKGSFTLISPDIAICGDCLGEILDPSDRRYLYPFINCTNCGPRYSITKKVPYDRPNTTMSVFNMCPQCLAEYNDPSNRRFHAQPNACFECGPQLESQISNFKFQIGETAKPIEAAIELLKQGAIVAVKGIGGFHLCCDAENEKAVKRLREHKRRSNKPFGLMAPDVETVKKFCDVSPTEESLLKDMRRPIVLLKKKGDRLTDEIAPSNKYLGFMLPYAPLHYLLFHHPLTENIIPPSPPLVKGGVGGFAHFSALVMTSGNLSEEPIVIDNEEAISKLSFVDAFLLHNRDIFMRVDDSVIKARGFIRRARGYVPEPIRLTDDGPDVLGCGADIKNTFTVTRGDYAVISQHIGDMENIETLRFFEESLNNLKQVYRANPVAVAYDLHPNYLSTRWALNHGSRFAVHGYGIQHHYAHIASVMAEHGIKEKVIGVAFDGTGYGTDGNIWGSEFLVCDINGFVRAAHFKYVPLPGSARAVRECWRTAISYLADAVSSNPPIPPFSKGGQRGIAKLILDYLDFIGFVEKYGRDKIENIMKILGKRQFSPLSSGAGRLFDAVSAIAGICDKNTFEGEAAITLENMISSNPPLPPFSKGGREGIFKEMYTFEILEGEPMIVDFSKMILHLIEDVKRDEDKGMIAVRFHNTIVNAITEAVKRISAICGIKTVALSGGVFQNNYLLEGVLSRLSYLGFDVYTNEKVPCNDAGISLGQAYIARERLKKQAGVS